ncbi:MAG: DEAD/DEAH box helicase [Sulfurimonas sp. RIFCSPLOWO2_12_FULL_36_74]|uniref:DEAD/DEAH box helicase n=1 Tax=Sulfurimonas sp. RIFCSPLOWO2_12_36_12 TaxID=1802253 RepID=UPI0008D2944D|nr:DEAD/DEAH box helicase [Sulfurimonas sp. RIFCSPLOWO2_12_36_12]OHE00497.1 MAG: DEAD/DEAH box helicase [Sulfurimonas sp. RIFCSPLOWO2_02_FULL_36_28]OHE01042.1 MAG: DEAD/DEAH box helicase [Sulfurimonas sp. RIFCSPLOWO2_12_36_12]OHE03409.1 MAG: DEAD/DEAH box helicase [Sulfurimonas sp. RIFCSPLOWO2_12_FULL_36_74]
MSFEKLGIIKPLLGAIKDLGYEKPTNIQTRAIPLVLAKIDVFATAQTGTGKTAAFGLPMLQRLRKTTVDENRAVRGIIIAPTRELSIQIYEDLQGYAKNMVMNIAVLVGGKDLESQQKILKEGVDIVIATPGRIMEHIEKGLNLSGVEIFVLDEADRMLDMGFMKEIRKIHPLLPKRHQTLLFSATYSDKVRKLSKLILTKPAFIEASKKNSTVDTINQVVYLVDTEKKAALLAYIIGSRNFRQVLVFTRTKASADELVLELKKDGLKCGIIHGDKTQANRLKTLNDFKEGKTKVLVATDIASRGLDIEELPFVINYELPSIPEDYVHRVGRTGRAGRDGMAISLIDIYEKYDIRDIEILIGMKIPQETVEGFEPDPTIRRKDQDEIKLKSEHKKAEVKRLRKPYVKPDKNKKEATYKKPVTTKKRKTTKRG